MTKFFRNIRQSLQNEGKTSKYLKYAFGEIILVVIGILIALQINNWNENRKDTLQSRAFLNEFKADLSQDVINMDYVDGLLTQLIPLEAWALSNSTFQPSNIDSLIKVLYATYFFMPIESKTFQKIQNAGITTFIGYETVFNSLNDYYISTAYINNINITDEKEAYYKGEENLDVLNTQVEWNILPKYNLMEAGNFPSSTPEEKQIEAVLKFASSKIGRNQLRNQHKRHLNLKQSFLTIRKKALELMALIDESL